MINLEKRARSLSVLVIAFIAGLAFLFSNLYVHSKEWISHPGNKNVYVDGVFTNAGSIFDANGLALAATIDGKRIFADNADIRKATLHIVGDLDGFVSTGLQTTYRSELIGYSFIGGVHGEGKNIETTIDSKACVTALNALGSRHGAVAVMNYKTGDILCSVSSPTFDPANPPEVDKEVAKNQGLYVNRVFSGFMAPGSIFKLVTAAAAIDNIDGVLDRSYTCKKGVEIGGETLTCHTYHSKLNFKKALVQSCNASFAQIALELGKDTVKSYVDKNLGFDSYYYVNSIKLASSKYPIAEARDIDFGWSAIGQHHDMVNPLHYMTFVSAIANNGVAEAPSVISSIKSQEGIPSLFKKGSSKRMLSKDTANTLKEIMRSTVIENYKETRFKGLELCAKSGTAEIEKSDKPHSWFVGFMDRSDYPYAFVVVVENGGAGVDAAADVASTVLSSMVK